jgi:type II secretory pathway pseudopilin PulG
MQLRLRTKLTLVTTGLVLLVVGVLSVLFLGQLLEQVLQEKDKRATEISKEVLLQVQNSLTSSADRGLRPSSNTPDDIHDYVRHSFEINEGLQTELAAAVESPSVYEVSVTDHDGMVLISSDKSLPGKFLPRRTPLSQLVQRGFLHQIKVLRGAPRLYEFDYPFNIVNLDVKPFGEVRVVLSSGLLLKEITPSLQTAATIVVVALVFSTLLAAVVSRATLAPLRDIAAQLDRISAGQYDAVSPEVKSLASETDELGQVSRKITQVGQQLRGVHAKT